MSFSFTVEGVDKAQAKARVAEQLDEVVKVQTVHARDRDAVQAAAFAHIDLLPDDDEHDVAVQVHGSMAVQTEDGPIYSVAVGVTAMLNPPRRLPE